MKRGRPKNIKTAKAMWEHFCNYRTEVKDNPIMMVEQKKGNTIIPRGFEGDVSGLANPIVALPVQRPLTMEGFQNYLEDNEIITDVTDYFENKENHYSEFLRICSRIRRVIRQDQIEGGMAGIYNPSITQRINGLTEKTDSTVKVESFDVTLKL
jgi:hypothetical protein